MKRTTPTMAAQERKTSDRTTTASAVGAVALVAMVAVAVATPVVAVAAAVPAAVVVVARHQDTFELSAVPDTRERAQQTGPEPVTGD